VCGALELDLLPLIDLRLVDHEVEAACIHFLGSAWIGVSE